MNATVRWLASHAGWPLPLLAAALALAWLADPAGAYPAQPLVIALQLVFMTGSALAVAVFVGRAFLGGGSVGLLLLVAGAVCLGLAGLTANVAGRGSVNHIVTIHNLCTWCAAACHFAGIMLVRQRQMQPAWRAAALAATVGGALAVVLLCALTALAGWLPPFFAQGEGGTLTRQAVLGSAVLLFALSGATLWREARRDDAPSYRRWYAQALLLLALGLGGVLVQRVYSGVVGWIGVITQLLGGVYLFMAAWTAMKDNVGAPALASPPRGVALRYALALAFVLGAAALHLVLLQGMVTRLPYILFFPAVVLAALYCGAGPAALAALLAAAMAALWFLEPADAGGYGVPSLLFLADCALLIVVAEALRRTQRRHAAAEVENAAASERERAAGALEAGRVKLDQALQAARMVAWEYDIAADRVTSSANIADVYGLPPGTAPQQAAEGFALLHPDDVQRHRAMVQQAMDTAGAYVGLFRILRPSDGRTVWIEERARAVVGADGRSTGLVGTATDVTERQDAEQRLRDSEQRYRGLFETMDQGYCVIEVLHDAQGRPCDYRFLEMNPAFEKHSGLSNALGKRALELMPGLEPFWIEAYGRVAATGEPTRFEHHAEALAGRWFDVHAFRLGDERSKRVAILFTDISERVRASAEREALLGRLREQDARKDAFLATLSHELRNPLAPLRTGLRLLGLTRGDAGALDRGRAMMERQVQQLVRLIDDLFDLARVNRGKVVLQREPVALAEVLQRAVEVSQGLIDAGNHALVVDLPDKPVVLDADAVRLAQVFSNLLNNAAKYSPRGSRVTLAATLGEGTVTVLVRDEGVGLAPALLPRVFDLYTQAEPHADKAQGGLGIGLTLVRSLVELHGGTVRVRSDGPGRGSEFAVTLPLWTTPLYTAPSPAPPPAAQGSAAPSSRRILIADDNVDAADTLAELLRLQGDEVRTVYDGAAAVEQAVAWQPQVLLLDLAMPGLDGFEACRRLRARPACDGMLIVALTGWGTDDVQQRCRDAGFDARLVKPVDEAALESVLAAALR